MMAGCFEPGREYPMTDSLVLTYPVMCRNP
jgi:hypothetical protein